MIFDKVKMTEYASFLEDNSRSIVDLCTKIEETLVLAVQCMDQQSGRGAAIRMTQNLENIKKNVPISDDASNRLGQSKKLIISAESIFGR